MLPLFSSCSPLRLCLPSSADARRAHGDAPISVRNRLVGMQELHERKLKKMAPSSSTRHIRNEARASSAAADGSVNKFLAVKEHFDLGRGDTVEMENRNVPLRCAEVLRASIDTGGAVIIRSNERSNSCLGHSCDIHVRGWRAFFFSRCRQNVCVVVFW